MYAPSTFSILGLPDGWYGAVEFQYPPHLRQGAYEEEGRCINTLKVRPDPTLAGRMRGQTLLSHSQLAVRPC